jgi:aspartate kinase
MGKTTDTLIEHFLKACENKIALQELDDVASMGERTSARLFAAALKACGVDAQYLDPSDSEWPLITDDCFGNAKPILEECTSRIRHFVLPMLERGIVPVFPGFVGRTLKGEVTTLGRGGSDVTAVVLARAMEASQVIIVTDVGGIMTADPKIVSNGIRIESIDAEKLVNLCDLGPKFIRRKAVKFLDGSFNVRIVGNHKNEFASEGTVVEGCFPKTPIYLGHHSPVCVITIVGEGLSNEPNVLLNVLRETSHYKIPILAWSADDDAVCVYLPDLRVKEVVEAVHSTVIGNGQGLAIALRKNLAFLRIVGVELENTSKVLKQITESLERKSIEVFGAHTVASNILIFVDWAKKDEALSTAKEIYEAL